MCGAPDVYEGAPLGIVAFFVIVPKFAYFNFLYEGFFYNILGFLTLAPQHMHYLQMVTYFVGMLSLIWGALGALVSV